MSYSCASVSQSLYLSFNYLSLKQCQTSPQIFSNCNAFVNLLMNSPLLTWNFPLCKYVHVYYLMVIGIKLPSLFVIYFSISTCLNFARVFPSERELYFHIPLMAWLTSALSWLMKCEWKLLKPLLAAGVTAGFCLYFFFAIGQSCTLFT